MKQFVFVTVFGAIALLAAACSSAGGSEAEQPMELSAGEGDGMMSCLPLDPDILKDFPVAFKGTVSAVDGERVTLDVDRWYKGGDADQVVLTAPHGFEALIGGITFEDGGEYLVSATDGLVNYCGFSGEATPELQSAFDAAFGS